MTDHPKYPAERLLCADYHHPLEKSSHALTNAQHIRYFLALIWLVNGLFCKVLGMVPRHERIVATLLGEEHAEFLTLLIGTAEIGMAAWIISGWRYRPCAVTQIAVIASMNLIEFFAVPNLLLWGQANAFFALVLIIVIYLSAFVVNREH